MLKTNATQLIHPFLKHSLFWLIVLLYFVLSSNINNYASYRHLFESYGLIVFCQIVTAYVCLYVLIPKFFNKKKYILFVFLLVLLLVLLYAIYNAVRMNYLDESYIGSYNVLAKKYAKVPYLERLSNFSVFLSKCVLYLTPTALLLMARFYKNQQKLLQLSEQKKVTELNALKHQLNPHFLFNTLNNLYALALKKADKTPEVIEKLSDILDYMLYRCNDTFVSLQKEIELIENYLTLEKIRYGKRVTISFKKQIDSDVKIAPLLLLTFIENAFKHGVSEALNEARVDLAITTKKDSIIFKIENTKPNKSAIHSKSNTHSIGLKNIKKQLELLYHNSHILEINDEKNSYAVTLKLNVK